ncbi:transporter substrate-binding domain-containing protein [Motilimonas sp. 1_MG-2023]|uniref:transglycosylase SLT domain-containing protein n=1 Tax=Motilimonas sp. 1_MG-2023 TaxID=3062672 RepID=UPI0026E1824F|nr:transporter substrate-binding domain-containing protein [Motilimonas sp. 1_MG-2023]MDO6527168.1 transporter substrate-binding domain-containing protein [Motilimonas sp. 1_MG-2023]
MKWFLLLLSSYLCSHIALASPEQDAFLPYYAQQPFTGDLDEIKQRRVLRALVSYNKTDFFIRKGKILGLQAELLKQFEKSINKGVKKEVDKVKIKYIPVPFDQLIPALNEGRGDIVAAFLTNTPQRQKEVAFVASLSSQVDELLITSHKHRDVNQLTDLAGMTIHVLDDSSYIEHLHTINRILSKQNLAPIEIIPANSFLTSEDLVEMLNAGMIQATVIDQYKAELWLKIFTELKVHHQPISINNQVGWVTRRNNPKLNKYVSRFIDGQAKQGTLLGNTLFNRYYKNVSWAKSANQLGNKDSAVYQQFVLAAEKYHLDAIALLAQAYQESHFNNNLVSPRGAVGIMQLLPSTAKDMGVQDYRSLTGNIEAAARYIVWLKKHYLNDHQVSDENALAMVWASYNAGPNKFAKMQQRAEAMGLNKNIWFGQLEIAAGLETGRETVQYVSNIYKYYLAYKLSLALRQEKQAVKLQLTH